MNDGDYQLNYHQNFDDLAQHNAGLSFVHQHQGILPKRAKRRLQYYIKVKNYIN
jgi:hypothetical protein